MRSVKAWRRWLARTPDPGERRKRCGRRVSATEADLAARASRVAPWWGQKIAARIASLSYRGAVLVLPVDPTRLNPGDPGRWAAEFAGQMGVPVRMPHAAPALPQERADATGGT